MRNHNYSPLMAYYITTHVPAFHNAIIEATEFSLGGGVSTFSSVISHEDTLLSALQLRIHTHTLTDIHTHTRTHWHTHLYGLIDSHGAYYAIDTHTLTLTLTATRTGGIDTHTRCQSLLIPTLVEICYTNGRASGKYLLFLQLNLGKFTYRAG